MTTRGPDPLSHQALVRYQVVSLVRARLLAGEDRASAVAEVADMDHATPAGELCRVSLRSVYRWLAQYEEGGAAALEDRVREAEAASRVLDAALLEFLAKERAKDHKASIPELLGRATEHGLLHSKRDVDRTTVYRALVRMKVPTGRTKQERNSDMRRFAYAHRMELVLADGKHFRAGATRSRRVAFFFLDDATRLGLHVVVGTSESAALFLRGFHAVLSDYGRMGIVYLDHGPGFVAAAVAEVCSRLEIALVHGRSKYPDGVDHEVPAALGPAGGPQRRIQITHRVLDDTYHVLCDGRLVRIHPVDLAANARAQRDRRQADPGDPSSPPVKTAADLAFDRDFGPVVDDDGGLPDRPDFDDSREEPST